MPFIRLPVSGPANPAAFLARCMLDPLFLEEKLALPPVLDAECGLHRYLGDDGSVSQDTPACNCDAAGADGPMQLSAGSLVDYDTGAWGWHGRR